MEGEGDRRWLDVCVPGTVLGTQIFPTKSLGKRLFSLCFKDEKWAERGVYNLPKAEQEVTGKN